MMSEATTTQDPTIARVRALMTRHGWTQAKMGEYLGVPQGTVGNWLQGTRTPSGMVKRLLDVLGTMEALAPALHAQMMPGKKGENK